MLLSARAAIWTGRVFLRESPWPSCREEVGEREDKIGVGRKKGKKRKRRKKGEKGEREEQRKRKRKREEREGKGREPV